MELLKRLCMILYGILDMTFDLSNTFAVTLILLVVSLNITAANAIDQEILRNGDFESDMPDIEIYKYPAYNKNDNYTTVSRTEIGAINGKRSLLLPENTEGGYKLILPMLMLTSNDVVNIGFKLEADKMVNITVEAFLKTKRVDTRNIKLKKNQKYFKVSLEPVNSSNNNEPLSIVIWLRSKSRIVIDDFKFSTTGQYEKNSSIKLSSSSILGVYDINETGFMTISGDAHNENLHYRILDQITDETVGKGIIDTKKSRNINLFTSKRGSFRVEILKGGAAGEFVDTWRIYAVINKKNANSNPGGRYGICMEEYGQNEMINAMLTPYQWYELANQIGAGNVRLFTAAMPDLISGDGINYDMYASDAMIDLAYKYKLEPLVELGSNSPHRLPAWLRTDISINNVSLSEGIQSDNLKQKFIKIQSSPYLDTDAYKQYLKKIMLHFGKRVSYYELWNEPGHKFKPEDFDTIANLTLDARNQYASHAKLVGFSSTKGGGLGKGINIDLLPEFTDDMMRICSECIDILSYHSEHAYIFLGKSINHRNEETGFVSRLKLILAKYPEDKKNIPIWDTERGIKWFSPHTKRIDYVGGTKIQSGGREVVSVNDVARRLPTVFAASAASGVDKLFWFFMNSGAITSVRSHGRFGFFDAYLEPMPHLPVYDAMTEILADGRFIRLNEDKYGTRVYSFQRGNDLLMIAYNWKEKMHLSTSVLNQQVLMSWILWAISDSLRIKILPRRELQ